MEKLIRLAGRNRYLFLLIAHAAVTWRFWQVIRRSRKAGFAESVAAGGHLVLVRALRNHETMTIPTYDADQKDYPVTMPNRCAELTATS